LKIALSAYERLHIEGYLNNNWYYWKNEYLDQILCGSSYRGHGSGHVPDMSQTCPGHVLDMSDSERRYKVRVKLSSEEMSVVDKCVYDLHHKLGYISIGKHIVAARNGLIDGIDLTDEEIKKSKIGFCYDCMRGKVKADPSGKSTNHQQEWKMFQKVAVHDNGSYSVHSDNHYSRFSLFLDYYSDYVWVYLVKRKTEFLKALKSFYNNHNV
jgi:hypothetical protein